MPRCDCAGSGCSCLIQAGPGIEITGGGSSTNPYRVTATATLDGALVVIDTPTVNLTVNGSGVPADPFVLTADATVSVSELTDVNTTGLAVGDVLVWSGTGWVVQPPPVIPAGAVTTGGGVLGQGTPTNPVRAAVSGTWGSGPLAGLGNDSTVGDPIYVDSNGQLRSRPIVESSLHVAWANVTGKPSTFPSTWNSVASKPSTFPSTWATVTGRPRIRGGTLTIHCRAGETVSQVVSFPSGWFTASPYITAQEHSAVPGNVRGMGVISNGTAGFTLYVNSSDTTDRTMSWIAIQNPANA